MPQEPHFKTDTGEIVKGTSAIIPILKHLPDGRVQFLGTGFFIAQNGVFVTAKHVLMDVIDSAGKATAGLSVIQFIEDKWYHRQIIRFAVDNTADVAVGVLKPALHKVTGLPMPNKQLIITSRIPTVGADIVTYAMPDTIVLQTELGVSIDLKPKAYFGKIEEYYPNGRDRCMLPGACYRTSMSIKGGASGGPVFDASGNVFALNSTGLGDSNISFISSILSVLPVWITDVSLPNHAPLASKILVSDLVKWGFVTCRN